MSENQIFIATGEAVKSPEIAEGIQEAGRQLGHWRELKDAWLHVHGKADFEQKILDEAFERYLEGKGPPVSLAMQEFLDDLWYQEA